jgi:hypothetical protein
MECLQVNGSKIELAVAIPGIPLGEFWQEKNNIISAHTDQTPKKGGNLELTINMGEFDQRLASMEKLLDQKLGGLSTSFVYTQIFAEIAQLRAAVNKLNELSVPSLNTANGSPSLGAPREAVSSASPAGSTGVLSDHSTPIFSSDSKSQLAIQLPGFDETLRKVSGAPDTGEPFCEKASPKIDPTLNEQLALDLGLVFKEGYARTAGVEPPTENCAVSGAPNPKRCPKCREYGLSMVYCGDILVCNKGEPMINPFRCFKDFVNCIRYQSGGKSGGYSDLVAANGDKIRRSMGYSVKRMGVGP